MGEFVEGRLEQFLPFFEQLKNVELLESKEVSQLVKKCRRYEYRLGKQRKRDADFLVYANYLRDLMSLIRKRRETMGYGHRYKEIEAPLKAKTGSLYYACAAMFKGKRELWDICIDYLARNKMNTLCSRAFSEALQFHSRDVDLRCRSAEWELNGNASIENSRAQLQLALRLDPQEIKFWLSLFRVELMFVQRMQDRVEFLKARDEGKTTKGTVIHDADLSVAIDVPDAVMDLKVAEIVLNQAIKQVENEGKRAELLVQMWQTARNVGKSANRMQELLWSKISELNTPGTVEYSRLASIIVESEDNGKDLWDCFLEELENLPSEKMHRLLLDFCDASDDVESRMAASRIRRCMVLRGFSTIEDIHKVLEDSKADEADLWDVFTVALKKYPNDSKLWEARLDAAIAALSQLPKKSSAAHDSVAEVANLFNEALKVVKLDHQEGIWRLAIDFSIEYQPGAIEEVFARCFLSASSPVACAIKIVRLDFVRSLNERELFLKEARSIIALKPNSTSVYSHICYLESTQPNIDKKLVSCAWTSAVNENTSCAQAWIGYIKYLIRFHPEQIGQVHQRATLALSGVQAETFVKEWTKLKQKAAEKHLSS